MIVEFYCIFVETPWLDVCDADPRIHREHPPNRQIASLVRRLSLPRRLPENGA